MEKIHDMQIEIRLCDKCGKPMGEKEHGNRRAHRECAYEYKKHHQKEKYKVGNSIKLLIQKNEAIAARLHKLDLQKQGIPYLAAMELGLKFNCPTTIVDYQNMKVHFFDHYGYSIKTVNGSSLIFIYNESELQ
jgi:hypothetical protein